METSCEPDHGRGLAGLSEGASAALRSIGLDLPYPGRCALLSEGEQAEGVMLLRKGSAKVYMSSGQGRALILGIAKPHEMLGLASVLRGEPSRTAAESLEPCEVTLYPRNEFLRVLATHAESSLLAAQQLASSCETGFSIQRQIWLAGSASEKVAGFLLDWTAHSLDTGEGVGTHHLTREEIGQMIGVARETLVRSLGEFSERGLAILEGKAILIPDRAALAKFANLREV